MRAVVACWRASLGARCSHTRAIGSSYGGALRPPPPSLLSPCPLTPCRSHWILAQVIRLGRMPKKVAQGKRGDCPRRGQEELPQKEPHKELKGASRWTRPS